MRYLDPKNDLTFRKIFGEHPDITKSFLNAILQFEGDRVIEHLEIIDPSLIPETPVSKYTIVDVRCKDKKGRQFLIEMQMIWLEGFLSRVLFNACKNYVKQLGVGGNYRTLQPVYSINLINEIFLDEEEDFLHEYAIAHQQNQDLKINGLKFVFVELKKFKAQNIRDKRLMVLWLRFLTEIDESTKELPPEFSEYEELQKASQLLESSAFTAEERDAYDKYWDGIMTEKLIVDDSMEKGMKKGRAEGRKEGQEEGKKQKAIEMAKKMLEKQMEIILISELTGLTLEEIKNIK